MAVTPQTERGNGRAFLVFAFLFFCAGTLMFRLFEKQVVEHDDYVKAAESQSIATLSLPANRGKIYAKDKDGQLYPLAISEWRYALEVSPRQVKNKRKLADALALELPQLKADDVFTKINNNDLYVPPLVKDLDQTTAERVAQQRFAGVFVKPDLARVYPEAEKIGAQILGFVGGDGSGKYGVEATQDSLLRGKGGAEKAKRDSLGRLIDILSTDDSEAGSDVVLTVDYNIQYVIETKLKEAIDKYKADSGSIIVMNPKDGAILGMAGQPTFNPNNISTLKQDELANLPAPAASNIYEPGSVFKPITMAAAIDQGLVAPDTTNTFGQSVHVLDREIFNAEHKTYGKETMTQVLENSDNVAMVWVSSLLGAEKEREYFDKFGFGKKSGVQVVGEQPGQLRDIKEWNDVLRSTAAFGQGISATTVQLAAAYSTLANGGTLVTPHLVEKTINGDQAKTIDYPTRGQVITAETAAKLRDMLVGVVELGHGKKAKVDGIKVGGKTGTAQVPSPQGGYYPDRTIGSFAGLFPADDPKVVMVVRFDNPKTVNFAESSAAPVFGDIAAWLTNYYQLRK